MNTDFLIQDYLPHATWSVGGGLLHGHTMLQLCEGMAKEMKGIRSLRALHLTPACSWSLDWSVQRSMTTPTAYLRVLGLTDQLRQPLCLNFDNPYVAKAMVEDGFGLFLVDELLRHNPTGLNSVAVADDRVAFVLRRQFPKLRLVAHMNRCVCEQGEPDADFINQLLQVYHEVQLYPGSLRREGVVQALSAPERCTVVVNDLCRRGSRAAHAQVLLLLAQMRVRSYDFNYKVQLSEQLSALLAPPAAPGNTLSRAELKELYAQGLRSFHVQAEQYHNGLTPAWVLMNYLLTADPQYSHKVSLLIYKVLSYLNGDIPPLSGGLTPFTLRYP
ncbi:MAG: hypothetical protein IKZ07_06620 [Akkermansia sp.]|nr:hypothetical protein [Akkermansia sp.]